MTLKLKTKSNFSIRKVAPFLFAGMILAGGFLLGANLEKIRNFPSTYIARRTLRIENISSQELSNMLSDKDFVFINVHSPYDGEIAGTDLFLEHDLMLTNKAQLPKEKDAKIVLYCRSGNMSGQALNALKDMGYTNVRHLKGGMKAWKKAGYSLLDLASIPEKVAPIEGFELPVSWGDIGPRLVQIGIIDLPKFKEIMALTEEQEKILTEGTDKNIVINGQNSRFVVNILWAAGLGQKSLVYEKGPLGTEYKGEVGNFASTGGWNLAKGDATNYLNRFNLVDLTYKQQEKVFEIASNVYRPCCGNSTAFPDCNHGMAALFAIELMAAADMSDEEIYKNVLSLNSFWFTNNYLATATHFARLGTNWEDVDAKLVLGESFSSSSGAGKITTSVGQLPFTDNLGGSCGT